MNMSGRNTVKVSTISEMMTCQTISYIARDHNLQQIIRTLIQSSFYEEELLQSLGQDDVNVIHVTTLCWSLCFCCTH